MHFWKRSVIAFNLVAAAAGCSTRDRVVELERRFDAGWRPTEVYCLFGGETPRLEAYCARQNLGFEGYLMVVNQQIQERLPAAADCQAHARAVLLALLEDPELRAQPIYSCDRGAADGHACHTSVLVTAADGGRWVVHGRALRLSAGSSFGVARLSAIARNFKYGYRLGEPSELLPAVFADLEAVDAPPIGDSPRPTVAAP